MLLRTNQAQTRQLQELRKDLSLRVNFPLKKLKDVQMNSFRKCWRKIKPITRSKWPKMRMIIMMRKHCLMSRLKSNLLDVCAIMKSHLKQNQLCKCSQNYKDKKINMHLQARVRSRHLKNQEIPGVEPVQMPAVVAVEGVYAQAEGQMYHRYPTHITKITHQMPM